MEEFSFYLFKRGLVIYLQATNVKKSIQHHTIGTLINVFTAVSRMEATDWDWRGSCAGY